MSLASILWQRLGGQPDPRSDREIQDDIEAEVAFHLEQRERDLVAKGMSAKDAHAAALRRFGNIEKVRAECRRIQLGGRVMLQRITLVLLVVLLATVAWLSFQSVASQRAAQAEIQALHSEISQLMQAVRQNPASSPSLLSANQNSAVPDPLGAFLAPRLAILSQPWGAPGYAAERKNIAAPTEEATAVETWLQRFRQNASTPEKSRELLLELRQKCSPNRALEVLQACWNGLNPEQRLIALDVTTDESHEWLARGAVHMGATDPDVRVADYAFVKLRELTLLRFDVAHRARYLAWHEANKDIALYDIVEKSVPALVGELTGFGKWNEICALYSPLVLHPDMPGAAAFPDFLLEAGALDLIKLWARDPDPKARVAAVQWLAAAKVDEVTARMILLPILADAAVRDPALVPAVCDALVTLDCSWRSAPLLDELAKVMRKQQPERAELQPIAVALANFSDQEREAQAGVPTILAWICRANSPLANEVLGDPALVYLTGVAFDPTHDAAWWLNWWSIHRANYPNAADTENGLPRVE